MLGNGRLEAMCIDSTKRLCHIRGKMRKKVWVNTVSTELALLPGAPNHLIIFLLDKSAAVAGAKISLLSAEGVAFLLMCRATSSLWAFVTTRMRKQMSSSSAIRIPCMGQCIIASADVMYCVDRVACTGAPLIQTLSCRYMADEARSLKAYGELPDSSECLHSLQNGCKAVCERSQGD